ncbi:MAG TPA: hypothetical protein VGC88_00480 [Terriglobales bacterium]|jgi:hypothetical protein
MTALKIIEQVAGAVLMALVLLDVFLTVLYARIGTGIVSTRLARGTWLAVRALAKTTPSRRGKVLSFAGPIILVMLVLIWGIVLTLGSALILHPHMGTGIKASNGPTSTDFISALFAGGSSISIVGAGNFEPKSRGLMMFYLFNSLVGMSVISLTLTYLMQIYSALRTRNSETLLLDIGTGRTGDAAELVAGIGPQGRFDAGYTTLTNLSASIAGMKEAHHFYPVLFYFRFEQPYYSVSRFTNTALDAVAIIKTALDAKQYRWLTESGAVSDIWNSSLLLLTTLEEAFIPGDLPERASPDTQARSQWRNRFLNAAARLQAAGIPLTADLDFAAERYIRLRSEWSPHIRNLAPSMLYSLEETDPALFAPASEEHRRAA